MKTFFSRCDDADMNRREISSTWLQTSLYSHSEKKTTTLEVQSLSWKHISIRFYQKCFCPLWRCVETFWPDLVCSISFLSSGARRCMAAHSSLCSLVHHPLHSGSPSPFVFTDNCSIRGASDFGRLLATRIRGPHCQNTYSIMQPNCLQLSWATLSIKVESANCSQF